MPDDTLINSLQSEINTDYDIKITGRYMESKNDIIKSCLNQIDTTEQKHLLHWKKSLHKTKSLS